MISGIPWVNWKKTTVCVCRWNVHVVCIVCTGAMEVLNVALSSLPSLSLALRRRKRLSTLLSNMPKVLYTFYRRKQEKAFKTQTTEWKQCYKIMGTVILRAEATCSRIWAGVRKVASADNRSIFYRACAKFVTRFASNWFVKSAWVFAKTTCEQLSSSFCFVFCFVPSGFKYFSCKMSTNRLF